MFVVQKLQNGAGRRLIPVLALVDEVQEGPAYLLEVPQLLFHALQMKAGLFPHLLPRSHLIHAQSEQVADFLQGEAKGLRPQDEPKPPDCVRFVESVARMVDGSLAHRRREETFALVVADGLDPDARQLGNLTDLQESCLFFVAHESLLAHDGAVWSILQSQES